MAYDTSKERVISGAAMKECDCFAIETPEGARLLRDVVEKCGLNIQERGRLSRSTGQYQGGADLVCALNQADGKPGAQGHDRAAPVLAGARILEAIRLKMISWIVEKALCP